VAPRDRGLYPRRHRLGAQIAEQVADRFGVRLHRRMRLLPQGHQLTGQLTMMLVMVGYTFTGLYLLFGG